MAQLSVATTRRYYWICPRCFGHVPRRDERCACGGSKSERKRAHERVSQPQPANLWLAAWISLGTFGLLWMLLE